MKAPADKSRPAARSRANADRVAQERTTRDDLSALREATIVDRRPEAVAQRKLQALVDKSQQVVALRQRQAMFNSSPRMQVQAKFQEMGDSALRSGTWIAQAKGMVIQKDNGDPWSAWDAWLDQWFDDGDYEAFRPRVRRIAQPPSNNVSVDYDIEFTWPNAFVWDDTAFDVVAHLHVRNGQPVVPAGGGIWADGLNGSGKNWNTIPAYNYFETFMSAYVE